MVSAKGEWKPESLAKRHFVTSLRENPLLNVDEQQQQLLVLAKKGAAETATHNGKGTLVAPNRNNL